MKSGGHYLALMATVEVKVPELNVTRPVEVEVFRDVRDIKVNLSYSIQEFVKNGWKELIVVIFGSSSVAGFIGWWFGDRKKKKA